MLPAVLAPFGGHHPATPLPLSNNIGTSPLFCHNNATWVVLWTFSDLSPPGVHTFITRHVDKMAAKENSELPKLFSSLQRATEDEDDEQVLDITKKILDLSGDDPDALHCRVVSLIHLSRFTDALQLVRTINKARKGGQESRMFQLEEAYCLYRQDKYKETLSVLSSLPQGDLKVRELQAQVAYRQEHYLKAVQMYQQLLEVNSESRSERLANYYAAMALCPESMATPPEEEALDTMEQCFNLACCRLGVGHCDGAMRLLGQAETLHQQSLEEDGYTEEEIAEEMVVIQVQRGYCHQVGHLAVECKIVFKMVSKRVLHSSCSP